MNDADALVVGNRPARRGVAAVSGLVRLPYCYARPDEAQAISGAAGVLAGDLNPHFFHWPSLTFYLFAAVLGIVSIVRSLIGIEPLPLGAAVIAARVVVALAGALTTVPVFHLTRRIAGDGPGCWLPGSSRWRPCTSATRISR